MLIILNSFFYLKLNIYHIILENYLLKNPVMWMLLLLIGLLVIFIIPVKIPHLKKVTIKENIEEIEKAIEKEAEEKQEIVAKKEKTKKKDKVKTKGKNRFSKYY